MTVEETMAEQGSNSVKICVESSDLGKLIQLLSSLIAFSYSVRVFPSKWQLIRAKLEQLNSGLIAANKCCPQDNLLLSPVLASIGRTANECHELARCCIDLSYSGKLLMQSDLDVVSSKFEVHIKDLSKVYTAGIMKNSYALVVSRPGATATLNDMKFYVKDLFKRMKIGELEMKNQALIALNEVLHEDERYVKIVSESCEFFGFLVNFLHHEEESIQEESSDVILTIAGFNSCRSSLLEAGAITSLIVVLEIGSNLAKEKAARALQKLTENSENVWSVSAHGGVTALLKICSDGSNPGELIGPACCVLKNLAGVDEIKRYMVDEGAISTFMNLLGSNDEISQISSIEFLQTVASGDEPVTQMFIREGGIQSLLRFLDPKSTFSMKTQEIALRVVDRLCLSSTNSINILMGTQVLKWIMTLTHKREIPIREAAVRMALHLCRVCDDEAKKIMGDVGFMPELMSLLESKCVQIREVAAETLLLLALVPKNKKRFIHEDSNIDQILQLLDPAEKSSGINKFLLSMLFSFTNSTTGRNKITSSRFVRHLKELAEAEVTEAKRVVKRLSETRFRSLLNRIWSIN